MIDNHQIAVSLRVLRASVVKNISEAGHEIHHQNVLREEYLKK
jgi:hypothetical protein